MTENQKMDLILQKLGGIEGGLASVGEDVRLLQGDVQSLKEDVQTLKEDVQSLKERVTNIEITLENETNRNIQLVETLQQRKELHNGYLYTHNHNFHAFALIQLYVCWNLLLYQEYYIRIF